MAKALRVVLLLCVLREFGVVKIDEAWCLGNGDGVVGSRAVAVALITSAVAGQGRGRFLNEQQRGSE